jgi:predicted negative regulator of RcsB-dependent stress response
VAHYETEEERIEAIRKWWKDNGSSILAGAVLGIGGLLGWKAWVSYQHGQAEAASSHYAGVLEAAGEGGMERAAQEVAALEAEYASTPYAALSALELAKLKAQAGDLDGAAEQLRWALEHADQEALRHTARLRLARVLVAQGHGDEALVLLAEPLPGAYTSLAEEIKGDALLAKGELEKARAAYNLAILSARGDTEFLQMKLNDLGTTESDQNS